MPAAESGHVEHHPEILTVTYAQWFAYIFAIWEEQFRGRFARFWDAQLEAKIRRSDIPVDYFGDIRLIRNDFVHNKGMCDESANVRVLRWNFIKDQPIEITSGQMVSLIAFFPKIDFANAANAPAVEWPERRAWTDRRAAVGGREGPCP